MLIIMSAMRLRASPRTVELVARIGLQERSMSRCMHTAKQIAGYQPDIDKMLYVSGTATHVGDGYVQRGRIIRC